jgi:uncharacterized protein YndB with AHSA1/START domain
VTRTLKFEVILPHSPNRVWRALTDSRALSEWLMPNDFEPRLGHKFQFRTKPAPGFDGIVHCEVTALEEPRRLAYSWRGGPLDTVVTWTLEPVAEGTRLRLEHGEFRGFKGFLISRLMGSGWGRMLKTTLLTVLTRVSDDGFTPAAPGTIVNTCSH